MDSDGVRQNVLTFSRLRELPANGEAMKSNLLSWNRFDAVLFDLDGVLTATATLHGPLGADTGIQRRRLREQ